MKSVRGGVCRVIVGLALVISGATGYGAVLVAPQSPSAPDSWTSCAGCVSVGSGIFGSGSIGANLGFVYSAGILTNDPLNPYGLNALDFVYSFLDNATSTDSISRLTATNFAGFNTDVGYFTAAAFPGGTISPTTVDRTTASTVGFTFNNAVGPGAETLVLVIKTNATAFGAGQINVFDAAGATTSVAGLAPVPEPALFWPLAAFLVAIPALRRRRVSEA